MAKKKAEDDRSKKSEPSTPETGKLKSSRTPTQKSKPVASTPPHNSKKVRQEMGTVPETGFHTFFLPVLNELAEASFRRTGDDWPLLGIYYRPASDPRNVFVIWVTIDTSNDRFTPPFTTPSTITSTNFSVTLNANQTYIQYVVDVATISSLLSQGGPGNHPDAILFNELFGAIRAGDFQMFRPINLANPKTAIAQVILALFPK